MQLIMIVFSLLFLSLSACNPSSPASGGRWYTAQQVTTGKSVFKQHCASCHGDRAQGLAADWQQRLPDGSYPPPPLNGSAHAWHHPLPLLTEIIRKGGALYDGRMPGFVDTLSNDQQLAAIAWFQSLWSKDVYQFWSKTESQIQQQGDKL